MGLSFEKVIRDLVIVFAVIVLAIVFIWWI